MTRRPIIAGNWKMNKNAAETTAFIDEFKSKVSGVDGVDIVLCPIYTSLAAAVEAAAGSNVAIGAQNVHWAESGAFTGEIPAAVLKDMGVTHVVIGHSERRQYFGETDESVNKRLQAALSAGLAPMVCVGELLEERESGDTEKVLDRQTRGALAGFASGDIEDVVIAYEPVWAIGTGKTATPEIAQSAHAFIRGVLSEMFGAETAEKIRIQYGGSMKPANSAELLAQPDIDGGLVGGASLEPDSFAAIVESAVQS